MFKAFETHKPARLYVEIGRGSVTADATNTSESTVEVTGEHSDQVIVEQNGDRSPSSPPSPHRLLRWRCQPDRQCGRPDPQPALREDRQRRHPRLRHVGHHADQERLGQVEVESIDAAAVVETGSGDISVGRILEEARIKSGSGDIQVEQAGASTVVATGSGDVEIGQAAGPTVVKTGSEDLRVATADGDVSMSTGSGDAVVERLNRGKFSAQGRFRRRRGGHPRRNPDLDRHLLGERSGPVRPRRRRLPRRRPGLHRTPRQDGQRRHHTQAVVRGGTAMSSLIEIETRQLIAERVRRAREPHLPCTTRRHQLATRLRKLATQIEN